MAKPITFQTSYVKSSSKLSTEATKNLSAIASEMNSDQSLRVQVTVHKDTSTKKAANEKLAKQKVGAAKSYLKRLGIGESRVYSYEMIEDPQAAPEKTLSSLRLEIIGKRSWFVSAIENQTLPTTTDERTYKVDSLAVGGHSQPFNYRGNFTVVRLNQKDPRRRKTYAEAGTEVSSAFQEYESKRLESEWLERFRRSILLRDDDLSGGLCPGRK